MDKKSSISIFVKTMRVNVRIGLHDFERKAPQHLDVSIELLTDVSYLSNVDERSLIDYSKLYDAILGWEGRDHVDLLETYMKELITLGFFSPRVSAVKASISKPDIFEKAQGAGLSVFMNRSDWTG